MDEAFLPLDLESQKYTINLAPKLGQRLLFSPDGEGNFIGFSCQRHSVSQTPRFLAHTDPLLMSKSPGFSFE